MKPYLPKIAFALICLVLVSVPLTAQNGKSGGANGGSGSSACAVVATPVLSTTTASGGINVGVFSRVGNCSSSKKRFTVTISAMSSCSEETAIASQVLSFGAGEYKLISSTYAVAPDTCVGLTEVSVRVYSGDTMLASGSTTLTVQ